MSIRTLGLFLLGHRESILRIAATPSAIWLGLMFVLSAGFAREYDGEDLLREPWHLLIPLGASLLSCSVLFLVLLIGSLILGQGKQRWLLNFRCFLVLFWMTAPLAWLYAIPFERLVSAGDAMRWNLALLGVVAAWRVLLMIRVVSVMFGAALIDAFFFVMLFADSVALLAIQLIPKPIVSMMGGIRHTESEDVLLATTCMISFFGTCLLPVWLIGVLVILGVRRVAPPEKRWRLQFGERPTTGRVTISCWVLAVVALLIWLGPMPAAQREQQLRTQVELAFAEGRVEDALQIMSEHDVKDFPPHYDPPPRIGYGQTEPPLDELLMLAFDRNAPPWVLDLYGEKFTFHAGTRQARFDVEKMDDDQLERYIELLTRLPNGKELAKHYTSVVYVELHVREEDKPPLSERRRGLLLKLEAMQPPREEEPPPSDMDPGTDETELENSPVSPESQPPAPDDRNDNE